MNPEEITDKERLDFIEHMSVNIRCWQFGRWDILAPRRVLESGDTLREAIDNAIMAQREEDK